MTPHPYPPITGIKGKEEIILFSPPDWSRQSGPTPCGVWGPPKPERRAETRAERFFFVWLFSTQSACCVRRVERCIRTPIDGSGHYASFPVRGASSMSLCPRVGGHLCCVPLHVAHTATHQPTSAQSHGDPRLCKRTCRAVPLLSVQSACSHSPPVAALAHHAQKHVPHPMPHRSTSPSPLHPERLATISRDATHLHLATAIAIRSICPSHALATPHLTTVGIPSPPSTAHRSHP